MEIIIVAGPNGAGKTTTSARVLPPDVPFVNADIIAAALEPAPGRNVDLEAGRILLARMGDLAAEGVTFAVETTLASKSLAPRILRLKACGYAFRLLFFWIPDPALSVERVASRVRSGGHHVPEETIRRRYTSGLHNLFHIYAPIADAWSVYDNSIRGPLKLIAEGGAERGTVVYNEHVWQRIKGSMSDDEPS